jgi:hypothetical protein
MRSGMTESRYFFEEIRKLIPSNHMQWRVVDANGSFSTEFISFDEAKTRLQSSDILFKETIFNT